MWTVFQLLRIVAKQNNLRVVPVVSPLPLGEHDVGRYVRCWPVEGPLKFRFTYSEFKIPTAYL